METVYSLIHGPALLGIPTVITLVEMFVVACLVALGFFVMVSVLFAKSRQSINRYLLTRSVKRLRPATASDQGRCFG